MGGAPSKGGYKSSKHSGQGTGVGRQIFPQILLEGGASVKATDVMAKWTAKNSRSASGTTILKKNVGFISDAAAKAATRYMRGSVRHKEASFNLWKICFWRTRSLLIPCRLFFFGQLVVPNIVTQTQFGFKRFGFSDVHLAAFVQKLLN